MYETRVRHGVESHKGNFCIYKMRRIAFVGFLTENNVHAMVNTLFILLQNSHPQNLDMQIKWRWVNIMQHIVNRETELSVTAVESC